MTAVLSVFVTSTGLKIRITIKNRSSCRTLGLTTEYWLLSVSLRQIRLDWDEILLAKLSAVSLRGNLSIICHLEFSCLNLVLVVLSSDFSLLTTFFPLVLPDLISVQGGGRWSNKTVSGNTLEMGHVPPCYPPLPHSPTAPPDPANFMLLIALSLSLSQ